MRMLGFSKRWDKLNQGEFTTFRFPRKDKDWEVGEMVRIVLRPRSKDREVLGVAEIVEKKPKPCCTISDEEARKDGFRSWIDMHRWLVAVYRMPEISSLTMNKLTLRWVEGGD